MSLPARTDPSMLAGLPLCDPSEIDKATGFVRTVRSLVTVPLTSLGLIASLAALSVGNLLAATLAGAATLGVVISLVRDTRFSVALDRLRAGRFAEAEEGMSSLVRPNVAPDRQRGRAEAYLAAIAWARGEHSVALRWTRERGETLERVGAPDDEVYLNEASAVLLMGLCGELDEAEAALQELARPPSGDRWARAEAAARLCIAFARDDVEGVRERLQSWRALVGEDAPIVSAWMAWALDRVAMPSEAHAATEAARGQLELVARHVPRLADWLVHQDEARLRYRG